jgi:hypothetical protein
LWQWLERNKVEWYQTCGFYVFDAIPFALFQPLLEAVLHIAASTGGREHWWTGALVYCLLGNGTI